MEKVIREAAAIIAANGRHRRGFLAQEVSREQSFNHLCSEVIELYDAVLSGDGESDKKDELADIFGVLAHIILHEGWSYEDIERRAVAKLRLRWSGYTPPPEVEK